jgi:hypothetical protein
MTPEQIPLIEIPLIEVSVLPLPATRETIYLVAAYGRCGWKIHRSSNHDEYCSEYHARVAARELSPEWQHRKVLRIDLD